MRIAIPQLNYYTGNIVKNREIMLQAIQKAKTDKADLIIFPELAICGPFPQDLLEKESFITDCRLAIDQLAEACEGIAAVIGAPNLDLQNGIMYNSAYFICNGEVTDGVHKTILSDYDIFEESRYFVAGEDNQPIQFQHKNIRIIFDEYEAEYIEPQDYLVILMGTIPFTQDSLQTRKKILSTLSQKYRKPIFTTGQTGGNTSVLFDGNSLVYNSKGKLIAQQKAFKEDFIIIDTQKMDLPPVKQQEEERIGLIYEALVMGIRDYFQKNNFTKAILGLSGGIDSAIVATLACKALGADNVMGLLMPSEFSTEHSVIDAADLAKNLGIHNKTIAIKEIYKQYLNALQPLFAGQPFNVAEENLQARIRGMLVMAMSNKFGYIALNTSNKSEIAVGYGTLYGDMCGSLAVIGDVYKTDIYQLARYINRQQEIIPVNIIRKAPSAELRPGQKDQDSLPDYSLLDNILRLYLEKNRCEKEIVAQGFDAEVTNRIIRMVNRNEYKRAQCPPVLRVSKKAFGKGRKMPF